MTEKPLKKEEIKRKAPVPRKLKDEQVFEMRKIYRAWNEDHHPNTPANKYQTLSVMFDISVVTVRDALLGKGAYKDV